MNLFKQPSNAHQGLSVPQRAPSTIKQQTSSNLRLMEVPSPKGSSPHHPSARSSLTNKNQPQKNFETLMPRPTQSILEKKGSSVSGDKRQSLASESPNRFNGVPQHQFSTKTSNTIGQTQIARRGTKPNQKKPVKETVDIMHMNADKPVIETESSLEFILNTLCKALEVKPKQAAALLTNNNQYLIHSVVKGIKGKHQPLLKWYQEMITYSKHLSTLVEQETEDYPESGNCQKVFQSISAGMYSTTENLDICLWCCRLQTKLMEDFNIASQNAYKWFQEKEGGFELCLHAISNHSLSEIGDEIVTLISLFINTGPNAEQRFQELYRERFERYYTEPANYIATILDMLPFIMRRNFDEMMKTDILNYWIDTALRLIDNQSVNQQKCLDDRIIGLTFLAEVWFSFSNYIDHRQDLQTVLMQTLRKCSREKSVPARIVAISMMFRLLDKFAGDKNSAAPTLYKSLIFTMIESFHDQNLREHYLNNFSQLFKNIPSIPISLLIEPLLKQMQIERDTFEFKTFDFEFFQTISRHPKLHLNTALIVADLLSKILLNQVIYATSVQNTLLDLFERFLNEEDMTAPMNDFVLKFEQSAIQSLLDLEKDTELVRVQKGDVSSMIVPYASTKQRSSSTLRNNVQGVSNGNARRGRKSGKDSLIDGDKEGARLIKKAMIVQVTMKILQIRNEQLNEQIKGILLNVGREFNSMYGYFSKGILSLLAFFSTNPNQLMQQSLKMGSKVPIGPNTKQFVEITQSNKGLLPIANTDNRGEVSAPNLQNALVVYKPPKPRSTSQFSQPQTLRPRVSTAEGPDSTNDSQALVVANQNSAMTTQNGNGSRLYDYSQKNMQDIDKILKKNHDKEEQRRLEEERKKVRSQNKKRKLKDMLDKRKAELGVTYERKPIHDGLDRPVSVSGDAGKPLIYDDSAIAQERERQKNRISKPQIELFELDQQEQRDIEAIKACMKKYHKLWKNLFSKYANTGFTTKVVSNFDQINEKAHTINYPEVTKLLKDHNMLSQYITKEELAVFFRLLNVKAGNKAETSVIDYAQYLALIPQVAFFSFSRPPRDLSFLPIVESLNAMIQVFRDSAKQRGQSLMLYEDPDIGSLPPSEVQLIKALNDKLKVDPQYPIPEGFFKVVEKTPVYDYRIPKELASSLPPARVIAVELLDEILNNAFGFHYLEPLITFQDILKVKHTINAVKPPQAEAIALMSKAAAEKKTMKSMANANQIATPVEQQSKEIIAKVPEDDHEYRKPKLNVTLKLEISKIPLTERPNVKTVAEVLEEMLSLVEEKEGETMPPDTHLPPRVRKAPGKTTNEIRKQKEEEAKKEAEQKQKEEEKRKKRKEELKQELIRLKEIKDKYELEEKKKKEEGKAKENEKKKKLEEEAKKRAEEIKKKIEEAKKSKADEEEIKKRDEEAKAKTETEKRQKEAKEFMKMQKDKLSKEFQEVAKEREAVLEKKLEIKKNQQENEKRLRSVMEAYIKDEKSAQMRDQLAKEHSQIQEFIESPEVAEIFNKYDRSLRHLYRFYAAQDKLDWVSHGKENMNLREFVRFTFQHRVIPVLIEKPEQAVKIFKQAVKSESNGQANLLQLDYQGFCRSLVRIAVFAQDQIGGQKEDLLSERMKRDTKDREEERKKKEKLLKQMDEKAKVESKEMEQLKSEFKQKEFAKQATKMNQVDPSKKIYQDLPQERILEINENLKAQEEEFFRKWLKIRETKGLSMKRDVSKGAIVSIKAVSQPESTIPNQKDAVGGGASGVTPKTRKTKEAKMLENLANVEKQVKGIGSLQPSVQVTESRPFDIKIISARTLQGLIEFIGILPEGHLYDLDRNLEKMKIENQGQKPNKMLKQGPNNKRESSREARDPLISSSKLNNVQSRQASRQRGTLKGSVDGKLSATSEVPPITLTSPTESSPAKKELPPLKKEPAKNQAWNNGNPSEEAQDLNMAKRPSQAMPPTTQQDVSPIKKPSADLQSPPQQAQEKKESKELLPPQSVPEKKPSMDQNIVNNEVMESNQEKEQEQEMDEGSSQPKPFATMRQKEEGLEDQSDPIEQKKQGDEDAL